MGFSPPIWSACLCVKTMSVIVVIVSGVSSPIVRCTKGARLSLRSGKKLDEVGQAAPVSIKQVRDASGSLGRTFGAWTT